MKKGLSLLLAASLTFSAFTSAALAADMTAEEKYNALVEAGIFNGYDDGEAHLDWNMTRAQAAKIVALVLGLEDNPAAASIYTDLAEAKWAEGFIGAATAAGILEGRGNGIFDPSADVTIQELAKIMVEALDIEVDEDATVEGADAWAGKYVAAAVAAGLIAEQSDYTVPASRELLVQASYAAYEQVKPVAEITATAAATGAKKITVTFNQAIDDSKASISVKYNNNTVNPSKTTFADDKKSVVLEFPSNLRAGDYTVTVSGLTEQALTSTVKVEAEKVAKIEFTTAQAIKDRKDEKKVTIGYRILNQYGETIDKAVSASASKGNASAAKGTVTITAGNDFTVNEKVAVSLIEQSSQVFASQTFDVVAAAHVATVGIKELYQKDKKELSVDNSSAEFFLLLDLKDQYGNAITSKDFASDLFVTVSNEDVATLEGYDNEDNTVTLTEKAGGTDDLGIKLDKKAAKFGAGTTTVSILSKLTGSRASFDISVKDVAKIDELTLSVPDLAPAGEDVEIPYTAIDQFGETIKHPTDEGLVNLKSSVGTIGFTKDTVNDVTKLVLKLPDDAKGTAFITAQTATNKFVTLSVPIADKAVPESISGVKGIDTLLKYDSKSVNAKDNVVVRDQYGREMSELPAGYGVKVAVSGGAVNASANSLPATFKAKDKGTSSVTLTLTKGADELDNSSYTFSYRVVDSSEITDYEATVTGTVYDDGGASYAKALEVKGVLADGSKVNVPRSVKDNDDKDVINYTVVVPTSSSALSLTADGKIVSNGSFFAAGKFEDGEGTVIVTILANNQVKPVKIAVSSKTPEITTLSLESKDRASKVNDNKLSINVKTDALDDKDELMEVLEGAIVAKDQYGVKVALELVDNNVIVSGLNKAYKDLADGDTFKVLVFSNNGVSIPIDIIITK